TPWLRWTILVAGGAAAVAIAALPATTSRPGLTWTRRAGVVLALTALLSGFAGTAAWSLSTANQPHTGSIPTSGPTSSAMGGAFGGGGATGGGAGAGG